MVLPFALLPFCPFALLPFCPFALLPFCPFALLPFCPFALLPFCPHVIALAPAMTLFKFWQLSREDIFLFLFSHFGSCVDIVDSPDVTLVCTDDNKDLHLSETN